MGSKRRRRLVGFGIVALGAALAFGLLGERPKEQHLRLVLGDGAKDVDGLAIAYVGLDGETAREASLAYGGGMAPRVVALEPTLPDGTYRLRIDLDTREGRRSVERQATLQGGSTQVDLTAVLSRKAP